MFAEGDIVIKAGGRKPAVVSSCPSWKGGQYYCKYLHNDKAGFYASENTLRAYSQEGNSMGCKTLYSFKNEDGSTGYGIHAGTNSQDQYLIEEKGSGKILIFDREDLEEVIPYTFSATVAGRESHYIGKPGSVKKGDVLLFTGSSTPQIAVVTALDTKNKSAKAKFKGVKLSTEDI